MKHVFVGVDKRAPVQANVTMFSIMAGMKSEPISISPILLHTLPINRRGLTDFTFSRWMVPWMMGYKGWAVFLDSDFVIRGDIADVFNLCNDKYDVMVCNKEGDKAYERAAFMLFNCAKCKTLTPNFINGQSNPYDFKWTEKIGYLPDHWNHLVGYEKPNPNAIGIHYTQGVPLFTDKVKGCEYFDLWWDFAKNMNASVSWDELMGQSKHTKMSQAGDRVAKLVNG